MYGRCSLDLWQCGSCDALTDSLEVIICSVELNASIFWELGLQNLLGNFKHEVATCTLADTTQNHDVVNLVELTVLCKAVTQIHANSLIEFAALRLSRWVCHCLLDQLQALRMVLVPDGAHLRVRVHEFLFAFNASLCCQFCCSSLAKVHVGQASVSSL